MKTINVLITIIIFLFSMGCEKDDLVLSNKTQSEFYLKINDSKIYSSKEIDFYDFSSHLIYLKDTYTFSFTNQETFTVLVDSNEIYSGQIFPRYSSNMPIGPAIGCEPSFYGDYIIPIEFIQLIDSAGNSNEDPRNDPRIIDALKKHNQYREGLSCVILSVEKLTSNKVKINLQLTNNDPSDLLYLDPDKMGLGLFHYFTNGLFLKNLSNITFTHQISVSQPESWNTWKNDWLSVIKGHESKTLSIIYDNFETITTGQFEAIFNYPGLAFQVKKKDLHQGNGRIWLGELRMTKMIVL